ncbi:glycine hydroxymethyltransferase [Capsaspora owczarzaki ATCC 30864]|uniref:Serine hydroxymethyltransferase n=1 Tax=Capsaspora owczarzaki (strain ATCC 30864) TaxID=595528 RepID=A0A0D2WMJ8_CAPO3|nr:glycine hydroxymethyltransferase [Capsaspora owczarzaki ATCC 30864]KJE91413.1 glycine hydroxymethyltransferase [Capsaspora owczarzaki ATCC 30864]|eukprot:XP_004349299.2 glycine hydroxymethyltransferase [Capsaspora owczarzaki ATCC 30864]
MDPMLLTPLQQYDPEIFDLIEKEKHRQWRGLELIASENFTSQAVMEANASCLTNKYSEGLPHHRYYGGNDVVDQVEEICQKRALAAFRLDPAVWGVNVQPYSGSTANFAALTALLKPHDRLMGLDLPSGGHLTHGYQTAKKKVSASAIYFESMPYQLDPATSLIDYNRLEDHAKLFRPNLLICGGSAYPRDWEYARLRSIADQHGAYVMCDMAHISGLVAAQEMKDPFEFCDVVTTTTHKTLRGPRAGLIFFRKSPPPQANGSPAATPAQPYDLEARVNAAVFPACQGGPHNNTIAAIAVALKQAATPEFRTYAVNVRKNAAKLADTLKELGYKIVTDGTCNHTVLWDLRPNGLTGSKIEKLCDYLDITLNKNSVQGDTSALSPGGVRLGSSALTSRGFLEADFVKVGHFLDRAVKIALKLQDKVGKKLVDFEAELAKKDNAEITQLRHEVEAFAKSFPMPGFETSTMVYKH